MKRIDIIVLPRVKAANDAGRCWLCRAPLTLSVDAKPGDVAVKCFRCTLMTGGRGV